MTKIHFNPDKYYLINGSHYVPGSQMRIIDGVLEVDEYYFVGFRKIDEIGCESWGGQIIGFCNHVKTKQILSDFKISETDWQPNDDISSDKLEEFKEYLRAKFKEFKKTLSWRQRNFSYEYVLDVKLTLEEWKNEQI